MYEQLILAFGLQFSETFYNHKGDSTMESNLYHYGIISKFGRLLRFAIGGALIAITMFDPAEPIGWFDIYALLGIPVIVSAIIGWDPLVALYRALMVCFQQQKQHHKHRASPLQ